MIGHAMHCAAIVRGAPAALLLAALWVAALLCAGCSGEKSPAGRGAQGSVPVTAVAAVLMDVPVSVRAVGNVEGFNTVSLRPRVGGELTRVGFAEGSEVRQGDLLLTIDPRPYEAALQAAEAALARDRARAGSARARAQRLADLVVKDYVTKQQYDDARAEAEAAAATVLVDSAAVVAARLDLEYCSIRAPITGRTGDLRVRAGNIIQANGEPLVTIEQIVPVRVAFAVPEPSLPEIRRYSASGTLKVRARASSDTAQTFLGDLTFIDNTVDETTGTILLKATFPNEDRSLWPGQFVDVFVDLTVRQDAIVIPAAAVQQGQQGSYVWVIGADQSVSMRAVVPGPRTDSRIVVGTGLAAGEQVVTVGQLRLVPGAKVSLAPAPGEGEAAR
jgi:membrane fusion protein, multidrug efflux system